VANCHIPTLLVEDQSRVKCSCQLKASWFDWLEFNGIFCMNRLYNAMEISSLLVGWGLTALLAEIRYTVL